MTQAHWAIRIYLPFEETESIDFIGNFPNAGNRMLDDIVVFSGIFGVEDHMLWDIHKDMVAYNFSSYSFNLRLFLGGDPESNYFEENYRVVEVGDDIETDRKLVYAVQEDYVRLDNSVVGAKISTLDYKITRTVENLLTEVLEDSGILPVIFCEHEDPNYSSIKFEYPSFTIDPSWTVRDFIQYIADENSFEWTVKHGILFIGPELNTYKAMKASKETLSRQTDNISKNYWNMKITWAASPLDVLYYYELIDEEKLTDMRCIWTKHWVGAIGDTTKGCFVPVATQISKLNYIRSLEGIREQQNAYYNMFKARNQFSTRVGRIKIDEGLVEYADEVTIDKQIVQYSKKVPRNIPMNITNPLFTIPKIGRTTPYLDNMAGLLFPKSNNLANNPNQLVFSPYGRVEQSVLGPYVMGNGMSSFLIPKKDPNDFRFQLPDGFCIYKKKDDFLLIQLLNTPYATVPTQDNTKVNIFLDKNGNIRINKDADSYIEIDQNKNITIQKDATTKITISSAGQIDIETAGIVNVGASASMVNIAGGVSFLSYSTHTHQVPVGPAIPGPPSTAVPQNPGAQTTKMKAT